MNVLIYLHNIYVTTDIFHSAALCIKHVSFNLLQLEYIIFNFIVIAQPAGT